MAALNTENLNVRYLAWKVKPDPMKWPDVLRKKASFSKERAMAVISGDSIRPEERKALTEGFSVNLEDLTTSRLLGLSRRDIRRENFKYLIRGLPQGGRKRLAEAIQVAQETISRWGKKPPNARNASLIMRYLELDTTIDLGEVPVFLSLRPIGQFAQRRWLKERLEEISPQELSQLFPALKRLLDREGH